jgi:hypothetical protein
MFKGVSQCVPAISLLYFGPFSPFHCSPWPFSLPPLIFQQLSVHILISSTCTDVMFYDITDALSLLFLSLLPQVPLSSSTVTNMFYIWVSICSCWLLHTLFLKYITSQFFLSLYLCDTTQRKSWGLSASLTFSPSVTTYRWAVISLLGKKSMQQVLSMSGCFCSTLSLQVPGPWSYFYRCAVLT